VRFILTNALKALDEEMENESTFEQPLIEQFMSNERDADSKGTASVLAGRSDSKGSSISNSTSNLHVSTKRTFNMYRR